MGARGTKPLVGKCDLKVQWAAAATRIGTVDLAETSWSRSFVTEANRALTRLG